jgi:RND family efflux transporter MFP subunit
MNDLSRHDRNDEAIDRRCPDKLTNDQQMQNREKRGLRRRWGGRFFAIGGFLSLAVGLSLGTWGDYSSKQEVLATAKQERDFVPSVRLAVVEASPGIVSITLPGTTAAFAATNIYARATGYIALRKVDIGDRVKKGDLLAELAVPELDDQISQNEATLDQLHSALDQAEANQRLAQVTWDGDVPLLKQGWVTRQQGDVDLRSLKAQEAAVAAAKHSVTAQEKLVQQLRQNREYASVVAPFDGIITQRNVDVGSLVQGNATSGTFMFELMQVDVIRVWVYVPQDAAFGVAPSIDAIVRVPEIADREFPGKVTRMADALQSGTRTLFSEVDLPNPDGALSAGIYCTVELKIPRKALALSVPADAIIFNRDGVQVAVVTGGKTQIRKVRVTRDFGTRVEVNSGMNAGDQVILDPPVNLVDGAKVQASPEATASKPRA